MKWFIQIFFNCICLIVRLGKPNGVKEITAENILLRQQLLVLTQKKKKGPPLKSRERIIMALCTLVLSPRRIKRSAILIAESTLLKFHKALVSRKYSLLFRNKIKKKPGPKGPSKELIKFIVETKQRNPRYGTPRIAFLASQVLGIVINESLVRRILKKHYKPAPGSGPSWLGQIGNAPNKLWSLDLFRVETLALKSLWVMVVMDHFTRRIIGFGVHQGNLDGGAICYLFNQIMTGLVPPRYLSTDNDPLFKYWLWSANLEQLAISEIKSVPYVPWSHPFIERKILSIRTEFTDHILIWSQSDLQHKLARYQEYFNDYRVHYAHDGKTPSETAGHRELAKIKLKNYKWKSVCGGLYQTPIAA